MALRISSEIFSQASTTRSKSGSIDDRSSQMEHPECSARAARASVQMTQPQMPASVPLKSHTGSIPAASTRTEEPLILSRSRALFSCAGRDLRSPLNSAKKFNSDVTETQSLRKSFHSDVSEFNSSRRVILLPLSAGYLMLASDSWNLRMSLYFGLS
jgi:hypothetical protein